MSVQSTKSTGPCVFCYQTPRTASDACRGFSAAGEAIVACSQCRDRKRNVEWFPKATSQCHACKVTLLRSVMHPGRAQGYGVRGGRVCAWWCEACHGKRHPFDDTDPTERNCMHCDIFMDDDACDASGNPTLRCKPCMVKYCGGCERLIVGDTYPNTIEPEEAANTVLCGACHEEQKPIQTCAGCKKQHDALQTRSVIDNDVQEERAYRTYCVGCVSTLVQCHACGLRMCGDPAGIRVDPASASQHLCDRCHLAAQPMQACHACDALFDRHALLVIKSRRANEEFIKTCRGCHILDQLKRRTNPKCMRCLAKLTFQDVTKQAELLQVCLKCVIRTDKPTCVQCHRKLMLDPDFDEGETDVCRACKGGQGSGGPLPPLDPDSQDLNQKRKAMDDTGKCAAAAASASSSLCGAVAKKART